MIPQCQSIDIIIPAWKAQKTLPRLLSSIASQTIIDFCKITIVNDCDGIGYDEIVNNFKAMMDVRALDLKVNGGPGVARQYGIDNTDLPYIIFADADDSFYGSFALQILYENLADKPAACAVLAEHYLEINQPDLRFVLYKPNYVWTFGKIYRREILNKYNIRFNETRANEDVGFNRSLKLCTMWNEKEKAILLEQVVYCWHDNPNSITRANSEFVFGDNIVGFIENVMYAIRKANSLGLNNKHYIQKDIISTMASCYIFYEQSLSETEKYEKTNFEACVKFYKEFYEIIELAFDSRFINEIIIEEFQNKKETLSSFIPKYSFREFMARIRKEA